MAALKLLRNVLICFQFLLFVVVISLAAFVSTKTSESTVPVYLLAGVLGAGSTVYGLFYLLHQANRPSALATSVISSLVSILAFGFACKGLDTIRRLSSLYDWIEQWSFPDAKAVLISLYIFVILSTLSSLIFTFYLHWINDAPVVPPVVAKIPIPPKEIPQEPPHGAEEV